MAYPWWLGLSLHFLCSSSNVVSGDRYDFCQKLCTRTPECRENPKHQSSYCKYWQNPPVCFGLYHRTAGVNDLCFSPQDPTCPETHPVRCRVKAVKAVAPVSSTWRKSSSKNSSSSRTEAPVSSSSSSTSTRTPISTTTASITISTTQTTTSSTPASTTTTSTQIPLVDCDHPSYRVGSASADFRTLQDALSSSLVTDGMVLLVLNGIYDEVAPIVVYKSVTICGESTSLTIFESTSQTTFKIETSGVMLMRLVVRQRPTASITSEAAIAVAGPGNSRLGSFILSNAFLEIYQTGIELFCSNFIIRDTVLYFPSGEGPRVGIVVYGSSGYSVISGINFWNNDASFRPRAIVLTSQVGISGQFNSGTLEISGNFESGPFEWMFYQDNLTGSVGEFHLKILRNSFGSTKWFVKVFLNLSLVGDLYSDLTLVNNTMGSVLAQGLFTIDATPDPLLDFRSSPLVVFASGNNVNPETISFPFMEANGSVDGLIAYNAESITSSSCQVQLYPTR